jgi:hypothetical protein
MNAAIWEDMGKAGATHVVFIMGQQGYLMVPIVVVEEYLSQANVTRSSDGRVRHYHVTISVKPNLELFTSGHPRRWVLKEYYTMFES